MESKNNDNYVLILEDRTEVENANETGKLSVISGIDDKGKFQTTEDKDVHQAAFLKFNNKDGLLKKFMTVLTQPEGTASLFINPSVSISRSHWQVV